MNRLLLTACTAIALFACGPQNIVEDDHGIPDAHTGVLRQEAKSSGGGGGGKTSPIAMKVQESAAQPGPFATSFSINATNTLFYAFDMPSTKAGHRTVRFEVYGPSGFAYQVIDVAVAAGVAPGAGEEVADVISGGYRAWAAMPVAGTAIQQNGMSGTWTAKVFLDGTQVASNTYVLSP